VLAVFVFSGPVLSGAVFLLLPAPESSATFERPGSYEPLHKGHVDLRTGLYIRRNEDVVVRGTPALVLRRTYLSGYREPSGSSNRRRTVRRQMAALYVGADGVSDF
jgi:hypothetical protein